MQEQPKQATGATGTAAASFDSLDYWRQRHEQYLLNPQGVGNASLDPAENEKIYRWVDNYVANIVQALARPAPIRVLDLGCGTGMLAGAFLRTGCEYTGIDISEKAVEMARSLHPNGRFEVANIADLPLTGAYDLIVERTVFIHLVEDAYWNSVIREVRRLLAPDGVFILIDQLPVSQAEAPRSATHVKFRLHSEYAEAFRKVSMRFDPALYARIARQMTLTPHTHFVTHAPGG